MTVIVRGERMHGTLSRAPLAGPASASAGGHRGASRPGRGHPCGDRAIVDGLSAMCPDVPSDSTARTKGQVDTLMRTYGLRFDVNCPILLTQLPVLARPAAARAGGERGLVSVPAAEQDAVAIENLTLAAEAAGAIGAWTRERGSEARE